MMELLAVMMEHIGGIIGLLLITAFISIIRKLKTDLATDVIKLITSGVKPKHKSEMVESIKCDADIYKELTRALFSVNGSRIGLYQFHNGNVFSTNNPIWKVSNTHEVCENGVSTEIANVQDIKASLLTPLISALVNKSPTDGVTVIEPCMCELDGVRCRRPLGVYRVDIEDVQNTFLHAFLMKRSVKFALIAPIATIDTQVVGFVELDFCVAGHMSDEELAKNARKLCDTATMISQMLATIEPDF